MMREQMTRLLAVSKRLGPLSMAQLMHSADVGQHSVKSAKDQGYLAVSGRRAATYSLTARGNQRIEAFVQGLARMPKAEPKHEPMQTPACFGLAQFKEWRALAVASGEAVTICDDCSHSFQAAAFMRGICHRQVWREIKFGKGNE